mgnify:CR=1 FL=1
MRADTEKGTHVISLITDVTKLYVFISHITSMFRKPMQQS